MAAPGSDGYPARSGPVGSDGYPPEPLSPTSADDEQAAEMRKLLAKRRQEQLFGNLDKEEAPATAAGLPRGNNKAKGWGAAMAVAMPTFDDGATQKSLKLAQAQKQFQKLQEKVGSKKMQAFRGLDINMIREEMRGPDEVAAEEEEDAMSDTKYGYVGEDASSFGRSTKTGGPLKKDEIGKAGDHDDARSSRSGRSRKSGKSGKSGQQTYRSSGQGSAESSVPPTPRTRIRAMLSQFRKEFSICGIYLWGGEEGQRLRDVIYPEKEYFWAYVVLILPWMQAVLVMIAMFTAQIERYGLLRVPALTTVQIRTMRTEVVSQLGQAWDVASALPSFARPVNAGDVLILFDLYPRLQAVSFGGIGMERQPRAEFTSLGAQLTKPAPPGETIYTWQSAFYAWDISRKGGEALVADLVVHLDAEGEDEIRVVLAIDSPLPSIQGVGESFASLSANGRLVHSMGARQEDVYSEDFRLEAPYEGIVLSAQSGALISDNFRTVATFWYVFAAFPATILLLILVRKFLITAYRTWKGRKECWANFMKPGGSAHMAVYRFRSLTGGKVYSMQGDVLSAREAMNKRKLRSHEIRLKRTPRGTPRSDVNTSARSRGDWNYPY